MRPQGPRLTLLAKVLARVRPHLRVSLKSQKPLVCSDPEMVARYEADPLCHRWATAAFGTALEAGRAELLPFGAELDRPILLLESGEDVLVDLDASEGLWSALRPGMLERHRLPGVFHEIFHDRQRAGAEALVASWLDRLRSAWNPSHRSAMTEVPPPESA
jgi:alpha-beta hydrolase superfamily lysophospholipase